MAKCRIGTAKFFTLLLLLYHTSINIYRLLLAFDEVYHSATEAEQKEFMKAFIERIEMFPEKRKDGSWIKKIVFNFPVPVDGEEVKELPLETETTVETVCLLVK